MKHRLPPLTVPITYIFLCVAAVYGCTSSDENVDGDRTLMSVGAGGTTTVAPTSGGSSEAIGVPEGQSSMMSSDPMNGDSSDDTDTDMNDSGTDGLELDKCGTSPIYDLIRDGSANGDTYVLTAETGNRDNHQGTCSTADNESSEAVVIFTAPKAGEWEFRTLEGPDTYDTLMYARARCGGDELDCGTNPDGAACCNDDVRLGRILQSRLRISMQAGQTVLLFVDHYNGVGTDEFTLRAQPFMPTEAPVLTSTTLVVDDEEKTVGFLFEGNDAEGDVRLASVNLFNAADEPRLGQDGSGFLLTLGNLGLDYVSFVDQAPDNSFIGVVAITFSATRDMAEFVRGSVSVFDNEAQESNVVMAQPSAAQQGAVGDTCNFVDRTCSDGNICVFEDSGNTVCAEPDSARACPADWTVRTLTPNAAGRISAMGTTDNAPELRDGSCGGGGGGEVFSFTADEAGSYVVRTQATAEGVFPILYVRTLCDYNFGSLGRDMVCVADNVDQNGIATASVNLEAGEQVFIFVDSYFGGIDEDGDQQSDRIGVFGQGPFELTVYRGRPPVMVEAEATVSVIRNAFGLRAKWTDEDGDVVQLATQFLDSAGNPLPYLSSDGNATVDEGFIRPNNIIEDNGVYSADIAIDLNAVQNSVLALERAVAMRVAAIDLAGEKAEPLTISFSPPPFQNGDGECDYLNVRNRCPEGQVCVDDDPTDDDAARCVAASAPTVDEFLVMRGQLAGKPALSVRVLGSDNDGDVNGYYIAFKDSDSQVVATVTGTFDANEIVSNDNGQTFTAQTLVTLTDGAPKGWSSIDAVVYDKTYLQSEPQQISLGLSPRQLTDGAMCNPADFGARCPAGQLCEQGDGEENSGICKDTPLTCPADWPVIDLSMYANGDGWSYTAEFDDESDGFGAKPSCGRTGQRQIALALTVAQTVQVTCEVDANNQDTLMFVRSHCGSNSAAAELACNDDAVEGDIAFQSRIRFLVNSGATAYVFLQAFGREFNGEFTITCTSAESLLNVINGRDELSRLHGLLTGTQFGDRLAQAAERLTLFAPTNEGFDALRVRVGQPAFDELLGNPVALSQVLSNHITEGVYSSMQLANLTRLGAIGSYLTIMVEMAVGENVLRVGGASVVTANLEASNGRVHIVDGVIGDYENAEPVSGGQPAVSGQPEAGGHATAGGQLAGSPSAGHNAAGGHGAAGATAGEPTGGTLDEMLTAGEDAPSGGLSQSGGALMVGGAINEPSGGLNAGSPSAGQPVSIGGQEAPQGGQ